MDDSDLPALRSIQLGIGALGGDGEYHRRTIGDYPYYYKNTMTMRSGFV